MKRLEQEHCVCPFLVAPLLILAPFSVRINNTYCWGNLEKGTRNQSKWAKWTLTKCPDSPGGLDGREEKKKTVFNIPFPYKYNFFSHLLPELRPLVRLISTGLGVMHSEDPRPNGHLAKLIFLSLLRQGPRIRSHNLAEETLSIYSSNTHKIKSIFKQIMSFQGQILFI